MDEKKCFLCGRNGATDPLERHHCFPGKNRDNSEEYGAVVWLCGDSCHRNGPNAAHRNKDTRLMLSRYAQKKVMAEQDWDIPTFRMVFGRNYLEE